MSLLYNTTFNIPPLTADSFCYPELVEVLPKHRQKADYNTNFSAIFLPFGIFFADTDPTGFKYLLGLVSIPNHKKKLVLTDKIHHFSPEPDGNLTGTSRDVHGNLTGFLQDATPELPPT